MSYDNTWMWTALPIFWQYICKYLYMYIYMNIYMYTHTHSNTQTHMKENTILGCRVWKFQRKKIIDTWSTPNNKFISLYNSNRLKGRERRISPTICAMINGNPQCIQFYNFLNINSTNQGNFLIREIQLRQQSLIGLRNGLTSNWRKIIMENPPFSDDLWSF